MLLAEGINLYNIGRDFHWKWNCIVTLKKISAYVAQQLIPDPIGIRCFNTLASLLDLGSDTITAVFYRNTSGKSTDP